MASYDSFYGGRRGASFVIVKSYLDIYSMTLDFHKGNSFNEVHFDEYVIIDNPNRSHPDNGKLFRRGHDYNSDRVISGYLTYLKTEVEDAEGNIDTTNIECVQPTKEQYQGYVFENGEKVPDEQNGWKKYPYANESGLDVPYPYTFVFSNEILAGGAEYVGSIIGPEGKAPNLTLGSWDYVKDAYNNYKQTGMEKSVKYGSFGPVEISYEDESISNNYTSYNNGLIAGMEEKNGEKVYHDDIEWVTASYRDALNRESLAYIGLKIPYLVLEMETDAVEPYEEEIDPNTNEPTGKHISADTSRVENDDNDGHPFYDKWHFYIPKGIKGDSIKDVRITTFGDFLGSDETTDSDDKVLYKLVKDTDTNSETYGQYIETIWQYQEDLRKLTKEYPLTQVNSETGETEIVKELDPNTGELVEVYTPLSTEEYTNLQIIVCSVINYDNYKEGQKKDYFLGYFTQVKNISFEHGRLTFTLTGLDSNEKEQHTFIVNYVDGVDIAENGTITFSYAAEDEDRVLDHKVKWIKNIQFVNRQRVYQDVIIPGIDGAEDSIRTYTQNPPGSELGSDVPAEIFNGVNAIGENTLPFYYGVISNPDGSITYYIKALTPGVPQYLEEDELHIINENGSEQIRMRNGDVYILNQNEVWSLTKRAICSISTNNQGQTVETIIQNRQPDYTGKKWNTEDINYNGIDVSDKTINEIIIEYNTLENDNVTTQKYRFFMPFVDRIEYEEGTGNLNYYTGDSLGGVLGQFVYIKDIKMGQDGLLRTEVNAIPEGLLRYENGNLIENPEEGRYQIQHKDDGTVTKYIKNGNLKLVKDFIFVQYPEIQAAEAKMNEFYNDQLDEDAQSIDYTTAKAWYETLVENEGKLVVQYADGNFDVLTNSPISIIQDFNYDSETGTISYVNNGVEVVQSLPIVSNLSYDAQEGVFKYTITGKKRASQDAPWVDTSKEVTLMDVLPFITGVGLNHDTNELFFRFNQKVSSEALSNMVTLTSTNEDFTLNNHWVKLGELTSYPSTPLPAMNITYQQMVLFLNNIVAETENKITEKEELLRRLNIINTQGPLVADAQNAASQLNFTKNTVIRVLNFMFPTGDIKSITDLKIGLTLTEFYNSFIITEENEVTPGEGGSEGSGEEGGSEGSGEEENPNEEGSENAEENSENTASSYYNLKGHAITVGMQANSGDKDFYVFDWTSVTIMAGENQQIDENDVFGSWYYLGKLSTEDNIDIKTEEELNSQSFNFTGYVFVKDVIYDIEENFPEGVSLQRKITKVNPQVENFKYKNILHGVPDDQDYIIRVEEMNTNGNWLEIALDNEDENSRFKAEQIETEEIVTTKSYQLEIGPLTSSIRISVLNRNDIIEDTSVVTPEENENTENPEENENGGE